MFFFFKQKTAYEMRISDWSSDVCSSDLAKYQSQPNELPSITSPPAAASPSRSASDAAKSLAARASLRRMRVASMSSSVIVAALGWTRRMAGIGETCTTHGLPKRGWPKLTGGKVVGVGQGGAVR